MTPQGPGDKDPRGTFGVSPVPPRGRNRAAAMIPPTNLHLLEALPARLRDEALFSVAVLPQPFHVLKQKFTVRLNGEQLTVPCRVYYDLSGVDSSRLSLRQGHLLDGILTRHHDGHIRQKRLSQILTLNQDWVTPLVVQLVGEYVLEIIQDIETNLGGLDARLYGDFLRENPEFLRLTEQRVISYWDCYYRSKRREEYAGFRVLRFFKECVSGKA